MRDQETRFRHETTELERLAIDRAHLVVQEVDLTAAVQLAQDRLANHTVIAFHDIGADRQTLSGGVAIVDMSRMPVTA